MSILKLEDCNLYYETYGNGSAIVLLHGLSDDLNYWNKIIKIFEKDYQIIAIDLRGHGKSVYKKGSISYAKFEEDIYHLLKYLKIEKAIFIGFSLGGTISLNFALKYPEMVEKLVLMSTFARISEDLKYVHYNIYKELEKGLGEFYDIMIPLVLPDDIISQKKSIIDKGRINCLKKNSDGIKETIETYTDLDIEDYIKNIKQPVLIIGGSDDKFLSPYKMMIRMFEEIEDSRIVFLNNTRHNVLIPRNMDRICFLIRNFLLD